MFITSSLFVYVFEENYCGGGNFSREVNFLLKIENSAMKIFKLFSVIKFHGEWVRMNITIHPSTMRGSHMEKSE